MVAATDFVIVSCDPGTAWHRHPPQALRPYFLMHRHLLEAPATLSPSCHRQAAPKTTEVFGRVASCDIPGWRAVKSVEK